MDTSNFKEKEILIPNLEMAFDILISLSSLTLKHHILKLSHFFNYSFISINPKPQTQSIFQMIQI
jgi:hypothetical protein